MDHEKTYIVA
jgi:hypothetical protein